MNPLKMQEMLEQARQMQEQMQEKLSHTVVEASSGGGAVTVRMNGQKQVLQLKIDAAAMMSLTSSPGDVETLTTGAQTWESGGTYQWELASPEPGGSPWDRLVIQGTLDKYLEAYRLLTGRELKL